MEKYVAKDIEREREREAGNDGHRGHSELREPDNGVTVDVLCVRVCVNRTGNLNHHPLRI